MDPLLSRITIDPALCHGKPCVRGLRYPVETLLELLSSGMTFDEILADYEDLERADLLAVLTYAARLARCESGQAGHGALFRRVIQMRVEGKRIHRTRLVRTEQFVV